MYKSVSRSQFGKISWRTFWASGSVLLGEVNVDKAKFQTVKNEIKKKDQEEQDLLQKKCWMISRSPAAKAPLKIVQETPSKVADDVGLVQYCCF